jgi:hypothetical protein
MARKPREVVQVKFRIPGQLHHQIEIEAKKNKRTLAQEMALRLERSFVEDDGLKGTVRLALEATKTLAEHVGRPDLAQKVETFLKEEKDSNG